MGFRKRSKSAHTYDDISSVVILEQTQLYKTKNNWGMSFGPEGLSDNHVIAMGGVQIPDGADITFSVTYKDGKKEIVKERSGTDRCNRLLQLALDPPMQETERHAVDDRRQGDYTPVTLEKNQLPNGKYLVGRDIPAGIFDFTWVFGDGSINIYKDETDTSTLGANLYFQWIGNRYDYEYRQCLNVRLEEGNVLVLNGNILVQIARSKKVVIDL